MEWNRFVFLFFSAYFYSLLPSLVAFGSNFGPFKVEMLRFRQCPYMKNAKIVLEIKQRRLNRTHLAYDVNLTNANTINDNLVALSHMAQMTNAGYKNNFFSKEFPNICQQMKTYLPELYGKVGSAFKKKSAPLCPLPQGEWHIQNLVLNSVTSFPAFFYNKYRMEIELKKKGLVLGCIEMELNVTPKIEKRN